MRDPNELLEPSDKDRVEAWRLKVLIEAGYPVLIAERIAVAELVDLHLAVSLLEKGCSPETAERIIL